MTSRLPRITKALSRALAPQRFGPPVTHVYNPLEYAWPAHREYLRRFGDQLTAREFVLVGMNPGPWGMAQTGVPFGEVATVREWFGIDSRIGKPEREHPKRPIDGFACTRSEVSGRRLWGWARDRFGTPDRFFARFFVWNYCPLSFMEESGRNRTPDKLPADEREPLFAACDEALRAVVRALKPRLVIGIGAFAEKRARLALTRHEPATAGKETPTIGRILHPSPASPLANRDWASAAERDFERLGVDLGR